MPHISLSSAPAGKEAREAVRTAIEQVQNEGGERTIGTPNRIALIFPPQITEGSDARRGVARAEERMDVASVVYQWGAGRDHAISAGLCAGPGPQGGLRAGLLEADGS